MKRKATFLNQNSPLNTCMIQAQTPSEAIRLIRSAAFDGADAFGFQTEQLSTEFQTEENFKKIFFYTSGKPIYATNYGTGCNKEKSGDELSEGLLTLARSGAHLIDIFGDLYGKNTLDITYDREAVSKQMSLAERIHEMGCEVLFSTHTMRFMKADEVIEMALEHRKRGADISKIVAAANTEDEELENLKTISLLRRELDFPFLFLCAGTRTKLVRTIGPMLGCCMWLSTQYSPISTVLQPHCRAIRAIADNFDYDR